MDLNTVKVHPVNQSKNSSLIVYLPKKWVDHMKLGKGDKITWFIDPEDHTTLKLRVVNK